MTNQTLDGFSLSFILLFISKWHPFSQKYSIILIWTLFLLFFLTHGDDGPEGFDDELLSSSNSISSLFTEHFFMFSN